MNQLKNTLLSGMAASALLFVTSAFAEPFDIPSGTLSAALDRYTAQTGVDLAVSAQALKGVKTRGVTGAMSADEALSRILSGTGFMTRHVGNAIAIVRNPLSQSEAVSPGLQNFQIAQAGSPRAAVETVTVTSSKLGGADVQSIPIAITALSQEQLTATQTAGGPDLVKQVPNLTFTKTNFTGYSINIRGIGTQAISVATDPAVAVAFNDTPFIRNHFFEQEFYDLAQAEVLRGPQGTLYGRNATAGVVNITSAKPTDQFEAMASADIGNYKNRRFEGMINIPFVSDKLDLRVAGEWTKRDGYTFNDTTDEQTDGRDLWSGRVTLGWKPASTVQTYLIWEHFQEDDDRLRSGKQLCKTDPGKSSVNGVPVDSPRQSVFDITSATLSQGCVPSSLYSADAFQVPNGFSLPFISGAAFEGYINNQKDPYSETTQSTDLRNIQSVLQPKYLAKNDTVEFNAAWNITPTLTLFSDSGYNRDFLWSTQDYNRYDTSPGIFNPGANDLVDQNGVFCDPQLGCSDRLVVQDLATEKSWQASQEFRVASSFQGPLNFSAGGNYLHYETDEKYYVFSNTFTMISLNNICPGADGHISVQYSSTISDSLFCLKNGRSYNAKSFVLGGGVPTESPQYVDPSPITDLDDDGHNYFLSNNPYALNSYALFGEAYYNVTEDLKLTGGLRWTDDQKHFVELPSQLLTGGYGYPSSGFVDQSWRKFTGRAVANWSPKLSFTDQSLFYASFAHGYKAGGANPPGPVLLQYTDTIAFPVHPLTFKPEYVDAFELGTKNTLLDGALTLNGDVFYYDYKGYQISQIVDRSAINLNFDATIKGAELEATYEPLPGLKFSFAGGYEDTRIADNQYAIDLIDRTAGNPDWVVMKPFVGQSSNCIFPTYVVAALLVRYENDGEGNPGPQSCGVAYNAGKDPVTGQTYQSGVSGGVYPLAVSRTGYPTIVYNGFDPATAPNNGEGFEKNLGGNELPNAPHFTMSFSADYSLPITPDWAATLHSDFYWQADSWARVENDNPYDRLHGYTSVNMALILTDQSGWQIMGYVKNIFDTTAITGDFLNSDDSGLTTNIFLTDPRLFGVRVTKHFDGGSLPGGAGLDFFADADDRRPQTWIQLGGNFDVLNVGQQPFAPPSSSLFPSDLPSPPQIQKTPDVGLDWEGNVIIQPENTDWVLKAGIRYGRTGRNNSIHKSLEPKTQSYFLYTPSYRYECHGYPSCSQAGVRQFIDAKGGETETHTMVDFTLGKDVGLGLFDSAETDTIAAGIRIAQFTSRNVGRFNADPSYYFGPHAFLEGKYHRVFNAVADEKRNFHGIGPELTWDATIPVAGNPQDGQIALDWGVNGAVLFGRQRVAIHHETSQCTVEGPAGYGLAYSDGGCRPTDVHTQSITRSHTVVVPNVGGHLGLSMLYHDAKFSFGYRADTFFNAIDGGQEAAKSYNRGFYGPYFNISLGLGG